MNFKIDDVMYTLNLCYGCYEDYTESVIGVSSSKGSLLSMATRYVKELNEYYDNLKPDEGNYYDYDYDREPGDGCLRISPQVQDMYDPPYISTVDLTYWEDRNYNKEPSQRIIMRPWNEIMNEIIKVVEEARNRKLE